MANDNVVDLDRDDVIDTSRFPEIVISIDTREARRDGTADGMLELIERAILGRPFPREGAKRRHMRVMELRRMDDIDVTDPAVRKRYGISDVTDLPSNVVPLKP